MQHRVKVHFPQKLRIFLCLKNCFSHYFHNSVRIWEHMFKLYRRTTVIMQGIKQIMNSFLILYKNQNETKWSIHVLLKRMNKWNREHNHALSFIQLLVSTEVPDIVWTINLSSLVRLPPLATRLLENVGVKYQSVDWLVFNRIADQLFWIRTIEQAWCSQPKCFESTQTA